MNKKDRKMGKNGKNKKIVQMLFTSRWLLLVIIIVVTATMALFLNQQYEDHTSKKLVEPLSIDNEDEKINWANYPTTNVVLSESLNIAESGTFHLTGTLENGIIEIDSKEGLIKLILDHVTLKNDYGPAILCKDAKKLVIEIIGDNTIVDGQEYLDEFADDINGAIFSYPDLIFQGDGSLNITANYQDAIVSKDNLKIIDGTYFIDSTDDGIRGNDSVQIKDGSFIIKSVADAIKSTNSTDADKGYIVISGGNLNIKSSSKGLESQGSIIIRDGNLSIEAFGDAVHSEDNIGIVGASINISSGDDAIHARHDLVIDSGNIDVVKSLEGLEAQTITINDGSIKIISLDDGINTAVSNEELESDGYFTPISEKVSSLTINGGDIYINADGDGIDSNGWILINGGNTVVDGPTNDKNGALDATLGIIMNGGQVLAIGGSGMAGTLGSTSSIYNISVFLGSTYPKNTRIEIQNSAGVTILEQLSAKTFSHIAAGSPEFNFGEMYHLFLDGVKCSQFLISDITTVVHAPLITTTP